MDLVIERTGVTYREAKEALEASGGDVLDAIIYLENNSQSFAQKIKGDFKLKKDDVLDTIKEVLRKGNVTKIIIEKDGEIKMNVPVNIGVAAGAVSVFIGTVMLPIIAIISVGMYIGDYRIRIVKEDGSEVDVNEETKKRVYLLKGYVDEKADDMEDGWEIAKDKASELAKEGGKKFKDGLNEAGKVAENLKKDIKEKAEDAKDNLHEHMEDSESTVEVEAKEIKDKE